jgi:hypothetical protein
VTGSRQPEREFPRDRQGRASVPGSGPYSKAESPQNTSHPPWATARRSPGGNATNRNEPVPLSRPLAKLEPVPLFTGSRKPSEPRAIPSSGGANAAEPTCAGADPGAGRSAGWPQARAGDQGLSCTSGGGNWGKGGFCRIVERLSQEFGSVFGLELWNETLGHRMGGRQAGLRRRRSGGDGGVKSLARRHGRRLAVVRRSRSPSDRRPLTCRRGGLGLCGVITWAR